MDETASLTPLDPNYIKVMRIVSGIFALSLLGGAGVAEFTGALPPGVIIRAIGDPAFLVRLGHPAAAL